MLDLDFVRAQFPAFAEPSLDGWAFFENAGGSYACRQVTDRLTDFYAKTKVQPYGSYPAAQTGGAAMDAAYAGLADILNVAEDEVHIGPSTTQNTYVLANAFAEMMAPGDTVVVTNQDHEANTGPWRRLAARGFTVREWRIDPETGHLDPADLDALLDDTVRVVCFPHVSNVVGEVNRVAEICAKVHAAGAVAAVDGVSAAPHGLPDVAALGADIYLFSAYKTFGPHQGVMTVRRALADRLPNQGHYFNAGQIRKRLVPAGPDHAQVAALAGVVDYMAALDAHHAGDADPAGRWDRTRFLIADAEHRNLVTLMDHLRGWHKVRVLGPTHATGRASTVALALDRSGVEAADALAAHKIMAGGGHFYAARALEAMGIDPAHGVLRLSFAHYTSAEEIARLIDALEAVV